MLVLPGSNLYSESWHGHFQAGAFWMDMHVPINPIVLRIFYTLLGEGTALLFIVVILGWFAAKGQTWLRRGFVSDEMHESADGTSHVLTIRRRLALAFGGLWVIDGLLQAQPAMSNAFVPSLVQPLIAQLPGVLPNLLSPTLYAWTLHPLFLDSTVVWAQISIGLLVMLGPQRPLGRFGLYVSFGWSLVIWVFGESFGSLLNGATWLTGAPGSALLYALAAGLLLQPISRWMNAGVRRWLTTSVGVMWVLCAFLQAWPSAGFWQSGGMKAALIPMAQMNQPAWMSAPVYALANLLNVHPAIWNVAFVVWLGSLGLAWVVRPRLRGLSEITLVFTGLSWWLGQDFGIVGGMGTDPNSGLPLLVLLWCARSLMQREVVSQGATSPLATDRKPASSLWATAGVTAVLMSSIAVFGSREEATASAAAIQPAVNNAGLSLINLPEPDVTLTDQTGRSVALSRFSGKAVVLTFLDPVCYNECPVIASEMKQADKLLGPYAKQVQFVAIDVNPLFHSVAGLRQFDHEEGLDGVSNWTYLTSSNLTVLRHAWHVFYEYVHVPKLGMVAHADNLYFISPQGREVWLAQSSGDLDVAGSYASFMAMYAEKLLNISKPITTSRQPNPGTYHRGIAHPRGVDRVQMLTPRAGWALSTRGPYEEVLRTVDGGRHWRNVTPSGISQRGGLLDDARSLLQCWVLVPPYGYNQHATLFETTNGGSTWQTVGDPGPTPVFLGHNALSVSGDGSLWLTGSSATSGLPWLYRSNDDGAHWRFVTLPVAGLGKQRIITGPLVWQARGHGQLTLQVWQAGTSQQTVLATNNGGENWVRETATR